jgi:hypothetical protein
MFIVFCVLRDCHVTTPLRGTSELKGSVTNGIETSPLTYGQSCTTKLILWQRPLPSLSCGLSLLRMFT